MSADPFNLDRFVKAQDPVFRDVVAELRLGAKRGCWMWFVFPQLRGLGHSWMADTYGISSRAEAVSYLAHAVLGSRLDECARLVNAVHGRSIQEIFGDVDAMKFRSSMTLFREVADDPAVFVEALRKYFAGQPDIVTLDRL